MFHIINTNLIEGLPAEEWSIEDVSMKGELTTITKTNGTSQDKERTQTCPHVLGMAATCKETPMLGNRNSPLAYNCNWCLLKDTKFANLTL